MLHQRLLHALDSSASLLFIEAIGGSGKRTVLRQWEDRGGNQHGEIRLRFDAQHLPRSRARLFRILWMKLRHRLEQDLADLPEDDAQVEEQVLAGIRGIRRPLAVSIHGVGRVEEWVFEVMEALLDTGIRLLIAGADLTEPMLLAQRRGVYFSTLSDREVWLTLGETSDLVEQQGVHLSPEALTALYRATRGHPHMTLSSLENMPEESAAGIVTGTRAVATFLAETTSEDWPPGFADFLRVTALMPRFTSAQAAAVTTAHLAPRYVSRLLELSLGRMAWHPGLQKRVFVWKERARQVLRRHLPAPADGWSEENRRIIAAARATGDQEVLVTALVQQGELDQAEELLRESIWDLLPNAMAPLWSPLEQVSPLTLTDRPALLSARLRLSPHRSSSPVCERAARRASRALANAQGPPWRRMGHLVHAITFALYAGERERMIDLFSRARTLLEDLAGSEAADAAGSREISELLLLVETVFRSGNTIPAAELGYLAVQLIESDPQQLDPRGERLEFVRRVILHDHRARGLEDVFDPESLLSGIQFLWRDADIVVVAMTSMWWHLDEGDFEAADAELYAASRRVADPEEWPILMLMRAHLAVFRQSPGELEATVSAYERGTLSEPGPFAQESLSQMRRITDYLGGKVGRPLPSPGYLPAHPRAGIPFYPRTEFTVHLMEALYAMRAARPEAARSALSKAVALVPRRSLGLYALANASEAEVRGLCDLAESVPGGDRLRLERALLFAGRVHRAAIDLSERQREVLGQLREGATNPQMAEAMFVSVNTVKFHRANLMRKLGATSRDELLEKVGILGL